MKRNGFDSSRWALTGAVLGAALVGRGHAQGGAAFDPVVALARAADANGDGEIGAQEWSSFVDGLGASEEGRLERRRLKSRLLYADVDGDSAMTARDLELALENGGRSGGRSGARLAFYLAALADGDHDGAVSPAEAGAFVDAARPASGGPIEEAVVIDWVRRLEAEPPPADRNALTPGVLIATFDAALDADSDGKVTLVDLGVLHGRLDTNGDGAIDAQELASRRLEQANASGADARTNWEVAEEARSRPPLMPWQRNLEDALAISRATGKPLLLCVNMDGESASDSLAYGRYRDPAFVELANGFVPLLASPDAHGTREHDDRGQRLPDERFGRLVDAEHIDIEPVLFERYFSGNRVAPRHVGVSPDGTILFDVYLVQDLSIIDQKLREFGVHGAPAPDPRTRSTDELLGSPDAADRDELERRFVEAGEEERDRLAKVALSEERQAQHPELVRLGLRDPSPRVRAASLHSLRSGCRLAPIDQLSVALSVFGSQQALRPMLLDTARCAAEGAVDSAHEGAKFFHRVVSTLFNPSPLVDRERWELALALAPTFVERELAAEDYDATAALLDRYESAVAAAPEDVDLLAGQAAAFLRLARIRLASGQNPTYFLQDVVGACERALARAPEDGRLLGTHTWASWLLGDTLTAGTMAERALPRLLSDAGSPLAIQVLEIFATTRAREVYQAISMARDWPADAIPDARAAYELLLLHPGATEAHCTTYLQFLGAISAFAEQAAAVRAGLKRFPLAPDLHAWLRFQVLRDAGARALEAVYDEEPCASARETNGPSIDWFHGLATFAAAEQDVANRDPEAALAAYARSDERFSQSVAAAPEFEPSAAHYRCLALAARARLLGSAGRHAEAVESIGEALRVAPASVESADGLGRTPADSARELHRALVRAGELDLARGVEAGLSEAGLELDGGAEAEAPAGEQAAGGR